MVTQANINGDIGTHPTKNTTFLANCDGGTCFIQLSILLARVNTLTKFVPSATNVGAVFYVSE